MDDVKQLYIHPQQSENEWNAILKTKALQEELLLADAADFGLRVWTHLQRNTQKNLRSLGALKGAMKNIPAIIAGAGPSLQKLSQFQNKALLLAAGTAFEAMDAKPHLAVSTCPHTPLRRSKHFEVPLCIQGRVHPGSLQGVLGELLYFPDSHFAFEPWLMQQEPFEAGWTVGNAAAAIAVHLGCNPIVFVGMDFCYSDGKKYGHKETEAGELISARDRDGKTVSTQRDWLLALDWMQQLAEKNREISFFNASSGMRMGAPIQEIRLEDLKLESRVIESPWRSSPKISLDPALLKEWRMSLKRCQLGAEKETEPARDLLLEPLWRIWEPALEKNIEDLALPRDIRQALFFEQVIEEHLADVREAFYPDGALRTVEPYKNGLREGETTLFWPNGQLKRRVHFVEGRRQGLDEMWDENGVLVDQEQY